MTTVYVRSAVGEPSNFESRTTDRFDPSRNHAYRRLTARILGLDVPTLTRDLRAARQQLAVAASRAA